MENQFPAKATVDHKHSGDQTCTDIAPHVSTCKISGYLLQKPKQWNTATKHHTGHSYVAILPLCQV